MKKTKLTKDSATSIRINTKIKNIIINRFGGIQSFLDQSISRSKIINTELKSVK